MNNIFLNSEFGNVFYTRNRKKAVLLEKNRDRNILATKTNSMSSFGYNTFIVRNDGICITQNVTNSEVPLSDFDIVDAISTTPQNVNVEYVDLGLPSGTKWAKCNIGASAPEEFGKFFSWGDREGYRSGNRFEWNNSAFPIGDVPSALDEKHDGVNAYMKNGWHIPSMSDFYELITHTVSKWHTINNVAGRLFTSKYNGNTLFLPAAGFIDVYGNNVDKSHGFYWTSELNSGDNKESWNFVFGCDGMNLFTTLRYRGVQLRGVNSDL